MVIQHPATERTAHAMRSRCPKRRATRARAHANASSGGYEDNLILDLAAEVDADLIVTCDSDLLSLGPVWKGRPVITPAYYVGRADYAARRRVH
jgi:hypothetical protein